MLSEKATKIDEIFTADLTVTTECQIDGEDFVDFCGLFRKHKHKPSLKVELNILNIQQPK